MCHNPGTWHNCSQLKLASEESCQRTNCKTKYKLESQNSLGTIVPVSLGNKCASVTWKQSCQPHLEAIVPASLGNNRASVIWEQLCQCH